MESLYRSKITILAGHYGSGKTAIAVNFALALKKRYENVLIADLDIVNPYFRTLDSKRQLDAAGIRIIASAFANSNVDLPGIPGEMNAVFDGDAYAVVDVGGDDRGALALGRYAGRIAAAESVQTWMVINRYRPLSRDAMAVLEVKREIEKASHVSVTGLVNNSHLGYHTSAQDVLDSLPYAEECGGVTGLPVVMTTVRRPLINELCGIPNLFPLDLEEYQWLRN